METNFVRIFEIFKQHFPENPSMFFSPGRLNFIGEHIDYNDGFVLPAAINKGIWFAIQKNNHNTIHCIAADLNEVLLIQVNEIKKQQGWHNYILGVLHVLAEKHIEIKGFNCVFGGNLPQGAGLSSSAAIEAGLLFALNEVFQLKLDLLQLALLAQSAEHSFPGVQCGIMDMFANLFGKTNNAIWLDCVSLQHRTVPLYLDAYTIAIINSKVHHNLASSEYNKRRLECNEGLQLLTSLDKKFNSFRYIMPSDVITHQFILPATIYKRCLFVTEEIKRVKKAVELLDHKNVEAFGKLLFETHEGLKNLYEVSCPEIDFLVNEAKNYPQVVGARLMGGGFGGSVICIVQKNVASTIINAIISKYQQQFNINAEAYFVQPVNGTHEILSTSIS
ncbi:MAG: galactokinase [Bacteroidota bacterium]|jgi:galactokinase|nr:galactokinase [Bacteroidota bacterium]